MDASFLHIERPTNAMHIGGVSIFEGPAPPFDELEAMVAAKLDVVPRYRQKVRFVPLGLGRPVWVDDPHFNLAYHLRQTALRAPGTDDKLRRTAARIFRCGRSGWWRGSATAAGRCCPRSTTAWSMASPPPTSWR
jgi:hypothetical protein